MTVRDGQNVPSFSITSATEEGSPDLSAIALATAEHHQTIVMNAAHAPVSLKSTNHQIVWVVGFPLWFMVSECGKQTQHAMRHTRAGFQQALMFAWLSTGNTVESPTDALQYSLSGKLRQVFRRQFPLHQVTWSQDTGLPGQRDDLLSFTVFHGCYYIRNR